MITPDFIGALTRWLLKGCKTNLFKDEFTVKNEKKDFIIGYIVAILLIGLGLLLVKYNLF